MRTSDPDLELIENTAAQWVARRDAGLTPAESGELCRWVEQDARHAEALARFTATWAAISRPRRTGVADQLARQISGRQRRRRERIIGVAGVAAVTLFAANYFWSPSDIQDTVAFGSRSVILTPESRTLPDGTVVDFRPGAKITVEFTPALRRVHLLQGEAHFSVAKNPSRPFVVSAAGIEVRAVGTAFSVNRHETVVGLLVTEGRVSVDRTPTGESPAVERPVLATEAAPLAFLDAGQQLEIDSVAATSAPLNVNRISISDIAERMAWRTPTAEFSGTPLAEVVLLINRNSHVTFLLEDNELAQVPLSGLIRLEDSDAFLRLLETGFGVQAERRSDKVIVLRRRRL